MSDESVRAALRSDHPLVVVEAPAGCGKTHQAAEYARDLAVAEPRRRLLILTHTHAACSEFSERIKGLGSRVDIRTIDSLIVNIASAYHRGLDLPADVPSWARRNKDGYRRLAIKVADLIRRHRMIPKSLTGRYATVICDEHQDANGDQHAVIDALLENGAQVRIFADPMQEIFRDDRVAGAAPRWQWNDLLDGADISELLDCPHRWAVGCRHLGEWTLDARRTLKAGGALDLRGGLPPTVQVVFAENRSPRSLEYQLSRNARIPIDQFEREQTSLLVLTRHNRTARSFRGFFNRRIPLWEGHQRPQLEVLLDTLTESSGDAQALAEAVADFLARVGTGMAATAFGTCFQQEVREGCTRSRRGKPALIQMLARHLVEEPDHRGISRMLQRLAEFRKSEAAFSDVSIDHHAEYWEAVRLGNFSDPAEGFAEITHRRTYSRPMPRGKAISTIHKAKGLQVESVAIIPCDSRTLPDRPDIRCLLYVALSRATNRLLLVVSRDDPSPLFRI